MMDGLTLEDMKALTPGVVVEDKHGDQAVLTDEGLWAFPETAHLSTYYVHKHYSPIILISRKAEKPVANSNNEMSVPPYPLPTQAATESEALSIIQSLRAHFGLVGTEFTGDDITSQVETVMSESDAEFVSVMTPVLVQAVRDDTRWRRLSDSLAECGNEIVGDIVVETAGSLSVEPLGEDQEYVIIATNADGHLVREVTSRVASRVPSEIARSKAEPGVTEVRVGVRSHGEDEGLYRA